MISADLEKKLQSIQEQNGAIPRTNTGWAENGLRAALLRRTWHAG